MEFEQANDLTTVRFYYNGVLGSFVCTQGYRIIDSNPISLQSIGKRGTVGGFDYIRGYLWKLTIYNYLYTDFSAEIRSSGCPSEILYCLSTSTFLQTALGSSCAGTCTAGCVRTSDCGYCPDSLCTTCSKFDFCSECSTAITFLSLVTFSCEPCDPTCKACEALATKCITCFDHAELDPTDNCICSISFYPSPTSASCAPCNNDCLACTSYSICTSCKPYAQLKNANCECEEGYYGSPSACQKCPSSCLTCKWKCSSCTSEVVCTSCMIYAQLQNGVCECEKGYFGSPENCKECPQSCSSCTTDPVSSTFSAMCTACKTHAKLRSGACECESGFFGSSDACRECQQGCSNCESEVCLKCSAGFYSNEGACLTICPQGFIGDDVSGVCIENPVPAYASVNMTGEVDESNGVVLTFSESIIPAPLLTDFDISLTDINSFSYNFTAALEVLTANTTFHLTLSVEGEYLPADNELAVSLINPEAFSDSLGVPVSSDGLSLTLHAFGEAPAAAVSPIYVPVVSSTTAALASSSTASGAASGLMSGNPTVLFMLVNNIQMLTYVPLSTIPLPEKLKAQMVSMNIQNFFTLPYFNDVSVIESDNTPPAFAQNYGFDSSSFLSNARTLILIMIFNLCSLVTVWMLSKCRQPRIRAYFIQALAGYRWRNLMMHWELSYLDISIAAYLRVQQPDFGTWMTAIDSISAFIVMALCWILPFVMLHLALLHEALITAKDFSTISSWKFLYEGQKNNKGCISILYHFLFIIRRMIYALALVFFSEYPIAQSVIFHLHSLIAVLFLFIYRPFIDKLEAVTVTITETAVCIIFSIISVYNFDLSSSISKIVTTIITVCVYVATILPSLAGVVSLYFKLREVLTDFGKNKRVVTTDFRMVFTKKNVAQEKQVTEG